MTLNVDLNWGNSANSLQLTIYSPDNHVFGPYYDSDDGIIDGRINLDIYNPNGIAQGTWSYNVYGYRYLAYKVTRYKQYKYILARSTILYYTNAVV